MLIHVPEPVKQDGANTELVVGKCSAQGVCWCKEFGRSLPTHERAVIGSHSFYVRTTTPGCTREENLCRKKKIYLAGVRHLLSEVMRGKRKTLGFQQVNLSTMTQKFGTFLIRHMPSPLWVVARPQWCVFVLPPPPLLHTSCLSSCPSGGSGSRRRGEGTD